MAWDKQSLRQALAHSPAPGQQFPLSRFFLRDLDGNPIDRPDEPPPGVTAVTAAVLALFYPSQFGIVLPLIERPLGLAYHSGQVSLPGGRMEASDASPLQTALRELHEELGVEPDGLELLGDLEPTYVEASNHRVHPFMAWSDERPAFRPDPREVVELFELPLEALLDDRYLALEEREMEAGRRLVPGFRFEGHTVWGATARILERIAWRLKDLRPRTSDDVSS